MCIDGVSEIAMDHCYSHQPLSFLLIHGGNSEGTKYKFNLNFERVRK